MRTLILLVVIMLIAAQEPTITVSPRVMFVGADVRVTCRVPRHPDNRALKIGFEFWTTKFIQLEGEQSRITFDFYLRGILCDPGRAFCLVSRPNETLQVTTNVVVTGCDPS